MLKWFILAAFLAGVTLGTFSSGSGPAKTRFGCPSSSSDDNANQDDGANDNSADGNTNENASANENANSSTNDNSADNANENTNGSSNTNDNSAANANENSSNTNANDNGDPSATINGRFEGTLTGQSVQSLNGSPSPARDVRLLPAVQFEGAFTPTFLPVLHYADTSSLGDGQAAVVDTETLTNVLAGQTQTFNYTDTGPVTLNATVTEASYLTQSFRVVLALTFNSTAGNLTRTGTGTETIEGELDASGNLVLSITTQYEIDLVSGTFSFDTAETIEISGTLTRQP